MEQKVHLITKFCDTNFVDFFDQIFRLKGTYIYI